MAQHRKADGRIVYTVVPTPREHHGAHRKEPDGVPLGHRATVLAVAVGVAAGTAALVHASSSTPVPMAMGLGAVGDDRPTTQAVSPGSEFARLLRDEQASAMQAVDQAGKAARDDYAAKQQAAKAHAAAANKPARKPQVELWIREAIKILQANGTPITEDSLEEIYTVIQKESGGNPRAINNWDSNAARGIPSKGLMQTIDPTFQRYKLPGHHDVYNPVDNIIAGVRYTYARYGGLDRHPGLVSMSRGGAYRGY